MSTEIRKASTTPILYNGANAVYAEVTTIRGVQRLITTIDRLWELSNRNDHFIRIEDHGRMVECRIERVHKRALNSYTGDFLEPGQDGKSSPVLAPENPSAIQSGEIAYSMTPRAFDGRKMPGVTTAMMDSICPEGVSGISLRAVRSKMSTLYIRDSICRANFRTGMS